MQPSVWKLTVLMSLESVLIDARKANAGALPAPLVPVRRELLELVKKLNESPAEMRRRVIDELEKELNREDDEEV